MSLYNVSHTLKHNFLASSRNWRSSMCPEFITVLVSMRLSNAVSISRHLCPALYPTPTCTKRPRTASFKLSSRAICAINDCLIPIDNRGRLTRLYSFSYSIKSLQRCFHARYSFRVFSRAACSTKSRSVCSILPLCRLQSAFPFVFFIYY